MWRWYPGRDYWYHDLMSQPIADPDASTEVMDAEDPLFILYTSGTTGKPKAILHTHGGYMVGTGDHAQVGIRSEAGGCLVVRCVTLDGSLVIATSFILASGEPGRRASCMKVRPTFPYPDRLVAISGEVQHYDTLHRPDRHPGLMRFWGVVAQPSTISQACVLLGSVGEPINPEAWKWYHRVIGNGNCPIMDTWWQTETGNFMITTAAKCGAQTRFGDARLPGRTD